MASKNNLVIVESPAKAKTIGKYLGPGSPMNDMVVDIIHRIENGELSASFDNLRLFN